MTRTDVQNGRRKSKAASAWEAHGGATAKRESTESPSQGAMSSTGDDHDHQRSVTVGGLMRVPALYISRRTARCDANPGTRDFGVLVFV